MRFSIRPLDLASDTDLAQFNALDEALDEHSYGASTSMTVEQRRAALADSPYVRMQRWVAVAEQMEGGEIVVGRGAVHESQQDNLDTVSVGTAVHPAFRGRGIATALLEQALIPAVHESGRGLVESWGEIPAQGDADDPSLPTNRLSARLGVSRKNLAVCRTLSLPLEDALLDRLQAESEQRIGGYRVELWEDGVPEEHLEAYGLLLHQLDLDEPDEEIEYEAPEYTPERIRLREQRMREAGTREILAVAIAPDGSIAGNSEIHVQGSAGSTLAWQENTLVMPEHRGHRLGLALKVATHRRLGEHDPQVRVLATFNSHVNPWMIEINEKLGYRVAFREVGYQGRPRHGGPGMPG